MVCLEHLDVLKNIYIYRKFEMESKVSIALKVIKNTKEELLWWNPKLRQRESEEIASLFSSWPLIIQVIVYLITTP